MIFIFVLVFGVLFLFTSIRKIASAPYGSIIAGAIVIFVPVCFMFRETKLASVGQAFLAVWLCEALLLYLSWSLVRAIHFACTRKKFNEQVSKRSSRIILAFSLMLTLTMCIVGERINAHYVIRKTTIQLQDSRQTGNFSAVFFSDLHLDPLFDKGKLERMIHDIDSLHPDFLLFGGDLSDMADSALRENGFDLLLKELATKTRTAAIAVNGNHEGYIERNGNNPMGILKDMGWTVLDDSTTCFSQACFTGRTDLQVARTRGIERKALENLHPQTDTLPWLLLDHEPKGIENGYAGRLPDFAMSGHTHNGQFFPGTAIIKLVWELPYGIGEIAGVRWLVSSGVDSWGPPVRIGSSTEIWLIEFVNGEKR